MFAGAAFNTTGTPNTTSPLVAGGDLHLGVTAPISTTIEQIDVSVSRWIRRARIQQTIATATWPDGRERISCRLNRHMS
jgi:hypothetical protein